MAKPPANPKQTGPIRSERTANKKRGNSAKSKGKIFGNPYPKKKK